MTLDSLEAKDTKGANETDKSSVVASARASAFRKEKKRFKTCLVVHLYKKKTGTANNEPLQPDQEQLASSSSTGSAHIKRGFRFGYRFVSPKGNGMETVWRFRVCQDRPQQTILCCPGSRFVFGVKVALKATIGCSRPKQEAKKRLVARASPRSANVASYDGVHAEMLAPIDTIYTLVNWGRKTLRITGEGIYSESLGPSTSKCSHFLFRP